MDPHDPLTMERNRVEQVAASQARFDAPGVWRRVDVELVVDAEGRMQVVEVAVSSGRRQLDDLAVAAVRNAAQRRPLRDTGRPRPRRVRFALFAGVGVNLPKVTIPVDPVTAQPGKGALLAMRGRLDSNVPADLPLTRRVQTNVQLLRADYEP